MPKKRLNLKIYGRVQDVTFRASAKDKAGELGLRGRVGNEPDGSVYCVIEGEEENLQVFLKWARKGPKYAKVADIEYSWSEASGEFDNFRILY